MILRWFVARTSSVNTDCQAHRDPQLDEPVPQIRVRAVRIRPLSHVRAESVPQSADSAAVPPGCSGDLAVSSSTQRHPGRLLKPAPHTAVTTLVREEYKRTVQIREAKANLSALVDSAARGESAVITRRGQPRAVLVGLDEWNRLRQVPSFGLLLAASGLEEGDLPPAIGARHAMVEYSVRIPTCTSSTQTFSRWEFPNAGKAP